MTRDVVGRVAAIRVPGRVPYEAGLEWQRRLARAHIEGRLPHNLLLLLEHEPVLTVGRGADTAASAETGRPEDSIPRFAIERGGDITYHGPGQLVGYPILDLTRFRPDLHWYVRTLERALILGLDELGLQAFGLAGHTGVWVGDRRGLDDAGRPGGTSAEIIRQRIHAGGLRKIASIGVHVSRWVTWHGFALNVRRVALAPFAEIVPCGIPGVNMTSLETEGCVAAWADVMGKVECGFAQAFEVRVEPARLSELEALGLGLQPEPVGPRECGG
jgi:lipoate-protein ligase B